MRRMLVTTASVIALGLGGIGLASAQGNNPGQQGLSGNSTPPAATTPTQSPTKNTTAMSTHRTMRMGRSEVIQAQRQLRADHLYRGRLDGRFGPETRTALRHFQQQNHLPLTARLDSRTMQSLTGGATNQAGQGSSRPPKRAMGANPPQNTSQPTGTMGQGSSTGPNPTPMTPQTGTDTGTQPMPGNNAGTEQSNPTGQTNQK
jgi:peptidoglycan hydrolase-like protein with peptidoglycan-binding domain